MAISDISIKLRVDDSGTVRVIDTVSERLGSLEQRTQRAGSVFGRLGASIIVANQAFELLGRALHAGRSAIESVVSAAAEQERQQVRLEATLRAAGQFSQGYVSDLLAQASALQRVTIHGDEYILGLQRTLIQFGAHREQLPALTQMVLDLASAYDTSADMMAEAIGGAIQGRVEPVLRTLRIKVDENATAQEKWARIVEAWRRVQGLAGADAEAFSGRIEQVRNAIGEVLESLGSAITESSAFRTGLSTLRDAILGLAESIGAFVSRHRAAIDALLSQLAERASAIVARIRAWIETVSFDELASRGLAALDKLAQAATNLVAALEPVLTLVGKIADAFASLDAQAAKSGAIGSMIGGAVGLAAGAALGAPQIGAVLGAGAGGFIGARVGTPVGAPMTQAEIRAFEQRITRSGLVAGPPIPATAPVPEGRALPVLTPEASREMLERFGEKRIIESAGGVAAESEKVKAATERAAESFRTATAAARDLGSTYDTLRNISIPDLAAKMEKQKEIVYDLSRAEQLRLQTAQDAAEQMARDSELRLQLARRSGDPTRIAEAERAHLAVLTQVDLIERAILTTTRERLEQIIQIARANGADAETLDLLQARWEQVTWRIQSARSRAEEFRASLEQATEATFDLGAALADNILRGTQSALSAGRFDLRSILRSIFTMTAADVISEAFRRQMAAIRTSGQGGLAQIAQIALAGLGQGVFAGALSQLAGGRIGGELVTAMGSIAAAVPLLAGVAPSLSAGLAKLSGLASLAKVLGVSTTTLGAVGGGLALASLIARPFLLSRGEGTLRFGQFEPVRFGVSTATGALAGAAIGTAVAPGIGTVLGTGIGTVIGAAIGGIIGIVSSLFGSTQRTLEDRILRSLEQAFRKAGLPERVRFRTPEGGITTGARFADTVIGRSIEQLLTIRDRGNLRDVIAAIERQPPERIAEVRAAAAIPGFVLGTIGKLPDPQALANVVINTTLALDRGGREALEMLRRIAGAMEIDFRSALGALHDRLEEGALSVSQFEESVRAMETLFADELPPGIDAVAIALRHLDDAAKTIDLQKMVRELDAISQAAQQFAGQVTSALQSMVLAPGDVAEMQAQFGSQLARAVAQAAADVTFTRSADAIRAAIGDIFGAIDAGDAARLQSALGGITGLLDTLPDQLGPIMQIARALQGGAVAQALRSQAEQIRAQIRAIELGRLSPAQRIAQLSSDLDAALRSLSSATAETVSRAASEAAERAQELLGEAQQFAPGSVRRLSLEAQAEAALREAERRLQAQADAEERRLRALVDNTEALRRLTDAILSVPAGGADTRPQRPGRAPIRRMARGVLAG